MSPIALVQKTTEVPTVGVVTGIEPIEMYHGFAEAKDEVEAAQETLARTFLRLPIALARLSFHDIILVLFQFLVMMCLTVPLPWRIFSNLIANSSRVPFGGLAIVSVEAVLLGRMVLLWSGGLALCMIGISLLNHRILRRKARKTLADMNLCRRAALAAKIERFNDTLLEPAQDRAPGRETTGNILEEERRSLLQEIEAEFRPVAVLLFVTPPSFRA